MGIKDETSRSWRSLEVEPERLSEPIRSRLLTEQSMNHIDELSRACSPYYVSVRHAPTMSESLNRRTQIVSWAEFLVRARVRDALLTPSFFVKMFDAAMGNVLCKVNRDSTSTETELAQQAERIFENWVIEVWTDRITLNGR